MVRSKRIRGQAWVALALSGVVAPGVLLATAASAQDVTAPVIPATASVATASSILQQHLSGRINKIMTLSENVAASRSVTSSDRAALNSLLGNEIGGLTTLQSSSSADTSIAQIRSDASTMVLSYHVYSFVDPVVHAVLRLDSARAAANRVSVLIPSIRTTIVASSASSSKIAQANSLMTSVSSLVSTIDTITTGLSATLLALAPTSVPGSLRTVANATATAASAGQDVHAAYSTIGHIVSLVSANPPPHHRHH